MSYPAQAEGLVNKNRGDKDVHIFLKGITPKVNIIARLIFEQAYIGLVPQLSNTSRPQSNSLVIFSTGTLPCVM